MISETRPQLRRLHPNTRAYSGDYNELAQDLRVLKEPGGLICKQVTHIMNTGARTGVLAFQQCLNWVSSGYLVVSYLEEATRVRRDADEIYLPFERCTKLAEV